MPLTLDLKKKRRFGKKEIIVIILSVIFTTLGIKASDNLFQPEAEGELSSGACPENMVFVSFVGGGFCVDKYEASVSQSCPYQDPSSIDQTRVNLDQKNCLAISTSEAMPWRNVSQDQAALACAKAGKRLPTNEEWLQAALGTPDFDGSWSRDDCHINSNWGAQPGLSGTGKNCVSAIGAYDMIGNVWEWVQGASNDGVYNNKKLPNSGYIDSLDGYSLPGTTNPDKPNLNYGSDYFWVKGKGLRGIVRGGYWGNKTDAGQYAVYMVAPPSSGEIGIGFRCVK